MTEMPAPQDLGQETIINSMKFLCNEWDSAGLIAKPIEEKEEDDEFGLCHGVAHMAKQAILLNKLNEFDNRLKLIYQIYQSLKNNNWTKLTLEQRHDVFKKEVEKLVGVSQRDSAFSDILAFFDSVRIYQRPYSYPFLYDPEKPEEIPRRQNAKIASSLVISKELETKGGICHVNDKEPFNGIYNQHEYRK